MDRTTRRYVGTWTLAILLGASVVAPDTSAAQEPTANGSSVPAGTLTEARSDYTTTLLPDGRVLVIGGWGDAGPLASAELWDPATNEFSPAGSLAEARSAQRAVLLPSGSVLVLGGSDAAGPLGSAELWDPAINEFSPAGSLMFPRREHAATVLADGRVLVIGGSVSDATGNEDIPVRMAEVWDPLALTFSPAGSLRRPRYEEPFDAIAMPDGGVLVVGGGKRLAERWDPVKMSFEPAGRMSKPRSEATLLSDGGVLVVGVFDPITCGPGKRYASTPDAELWDPETRSFSPAGAFRQPRIGASTVLLPDGRVLFVGGYDAVCMSEPGLRSAELWGPETRSFQRAGRPQMPREEHTMTVLPGGRVALIGGVASPGCGRKDTTKCRDSVVSGSVELWDPATRSFSASGTLIEARSGHTATLLPDGRILIVGGYDADDRVLASAEVWAPTIEASGSGAAPPVGEHQAPALELALPTEILGKRSETNSYIGEAAAEEWDESFLVNYLLASTCRDIDSFAMAILDGDRRVLALRLAGADPARLRAAYMQGRRFTGPASEPVAGPYGGFVAGADWQPLEVPFEDRVVIDYGIEADGFYAYAVGDTIFEIYPALPTLRRVTDVRLYGPTETPAPVSEIVQLLPAPGADSRAFGPRLESAPTDCPGADPELLTLLPTSLDGMRFDPFPMPPGWGFNRPELVKATGVAGDSISGYLYFVSIGSMAVAYRVPGADRADLEAACGPLQRLRKKDMKRVDRGGRQVLASRDQTSVCYVYGDMVFVVPAELAKAFMRSLPLP